MISMKKPTIFFLTLFLFVFCSILALWILFGKNTTLPKSSGDLGPITNIEYWTWSHEMILYLDYSQTGTINFLRIFSPALKSLIDSGQVHLKYRIAWNTSDALHRALYCSYSFGVHFEYNKNLLKSDIFSLSPESTLNLDQIAQSLGVDARRFRDCREKKYFLSSIVRDREDYKSMNIKRLPLLIVDGKIIDIFSFTPETLIETLLWEFWPTQFWSPQRIMPPGWWQREDGQSWAVDESLFERRIGR